MSDPTKTVILAVTHDGMPSGTKTTLRADRAAELVRVGIARDEQPKPEPATQNKKGD